MSHNYEVQGGASMAMANFKAEDGVLLDKLFDERLLLVDCQLVRKSFITMCENLLDSDCLGKEQAVFLAKYALSDQGIMHKNPIVVSLGAKLLLKIYQKMLVPLTEESP